MTDREYFNNRRKNRRKKFIDFLGGKCNWCGSKKDLQFDHIHAKTKKHHIADLVDSNQADAEKELKKCQLLCLTCHRMKTHKNWEYASAPSKHGSLWRYIHFKCRCPKCKKAMSAYYYGRKAKIDKD